MAESTVQAVKTFLENFPPPSWVEYRISVMVNACTGKMGKAFIEIAETRGMYVIPVSFGSEEKSGKTYQICGKEFLVQGPSSDRENILETVLDAYPDMLIVDFTVPSAVNANAELYCKVGVPFIMGTNGGDRDLLFSTIKNSTNLAIVAPQMGEQVAAFHGALEILADAFPGAFWGYSLDVVESHQEGEISPCGTVKAVVPCLVRMGMYFDEDKMDSVRDSQMQRQMGGAVPEEHLSGHACHLFGWSSPDET